MKTKVLTQKAEEQAERSRALNAVDNEIKAFESFAKEHYSMAMECLILVAQKWAAMSNEARAKAVEKNTFIRSQADLWNRIAAKTLHPFLVECSLPSDRMGLLSCLPYDMQSPEEMNKPRELFGKFSAEVRTTSLLNMTTMELEQAIDRDAKALRTVDQQRKAIQADKLRAQEAACSAYRDPDPVVPLCVAKWTDDGGAVLTRPLPNPSIIPAKLAQEIAKGMAK